jgi:hypothetical protein
MYISGDLVVLAVLVFVVIILFWAAARKKERLAPMLKRALQGDELSYQSNVGAGFNPPGSRASEAPLII